jgi:FtsZ-binding cell division protein ZapB
MTALDRDNAIVINQLEAHVAKINFELATTKALLDELRLENRHLTDDVKAVLEENDRLHDENDRLHDENDRLQTTIQIMEKEKLLRRKSSVQESIGTVHTTTNPLEERKFSRVDWSGSEFQDLVQDAEDLWGERIWSESTAGGRNTFDTAYTTRRKTVDELATYKSELKQLTNSTASDAFSSLSPDIVPPPMPKPARNGSKKGDLDVPFNNVDTVTKSSSYSISGNGAVPPMLPNDELDVPFSNTDDDESSSSNYSTHSVMLGEPGNDKDVHDRNRNDEKQDMSNMGRLSLLKLIVGNTEKLQTKQVHKSCLSSFDQKKKTQVDDFDDPFSTWSARGDPKRTDEKWIQSGQRGFSDGMNKKLGQDMDVSDISLDCSTADKQYDGVQKYSSFFENRSDDGKKKGFNLFNSFWK